MAKVVLIGFGLVALGMGALCGWIGWSSRRNAQRTADLRPLDAHGIAEGPVGTAGYVEGRIAARNPALARDFVLYYRSALHGYKTEDGRRRPIWKSVDQALPPLWIETAGEEVRISGGYAVTFRGRDPSWVTAEEPEPGVTERYEGLAAGQTVTAVGRVAESEEGRMLETETLASGTFEEYAEGERGSAVFGLVAGAVLLAVAVALFVVAGAG